MAQMSFNSRPRAEGDRYDGRTSRRETCFNSRPRAEGDLLLIGSEQSTGVSIHALARRATCRFCYLRRRKSSFNSRPRAEGDAPRLPLCASSVRFNSRPRAEGDHPGAARSTPRMMFQFTPSRGGRRNRGLPVGILPWSFNSRPRAEGDLLGCISARHQSVSIHALARRATLSYFFKRSEKFVSIHALARRAT